jgi:predicted nucleic acid-binding protein
LDAYAEIDDHSRRNGIAMSKNDVWIAATARAAGARLLTTDRDFDHLSPAFLARDWIDPVT